MAREVAPPGLVPASEIDVIDLPDNELTRNLIDRLREAQSQAFVAATQGERAS